MSNQKPRSLVNPITARWLEASVDLAPSVDCTKCSLATVRPEYGARWRDYKCCTFQPFVANYVCGAMLEAGLKPLDIAPSKAVLQPIGVVATAGFRALYMATDEDLRGEEHLCSYYDQSLRQCRVWEFRPAECSLFYCTTDSAREKRDELSHRAFALESNMAQMALIELGYNPHLVDAQVIELNDPDPALASLSVREASELYRACWSWVQALSPDEVHSLVGF